MKTQLITRTLFALLFATSLQAQDVTTVTAKNSDISDNLDLKAVASIFGDSKDLADFEQRLNNPKDQISNLDLNNDGHVDYLRVIESVDSNTHLIILQSVLDKDVFQDVATIEVEKDSNNQVQVQVVGNSYIYGQNYIYEPVYVHTPIIYSNFWIGSYQPYYSPWYWNYYPTYYTYWSPYPIFRYRRHIHTHINVHHHYNYVNTRRSERAVALYSGRRSNGYEQLHPNRSFTQRNTNVTNRYDLDRTRRNNNTNSVTRNNSTDYPTRNTTRNSNVVRENNSSVTVRGPRSTTVTPNSNGTGNTTRNTTRGNTDRNNTVTPQVNTPTRQAPTRSTTPTVTRSQRQQTVAPSQPTQSSTPRNNTVRRQESPTVSQPQSGGNSSPQRESSRRNTRG